MDPTESSTDRLPVGLYVRDRDDDDESNRAVVIQTPDATCDAWYIQGTEKTVAEYNQDYPADAAVIIVVFEPTLDAIDDWHALSQSEFETTVLEHDLPVYAYPAHRLEALEPALAELTSPAGGARETTHRECELNADEEEVESVDSIEVWFDGACEPVNPGGHGTYGYVVEHDDTVLDTARGYLGSGESMTNNVAKYAALTAALEYTTEHYPSASVTIYGDSQLAIRQMTGEYAVRSARIRPQWQQAQQLARPLDVSFEWVPREQNEHADALSWRAYVEHVEKNALEERRKRAQNEEMTVDHIEDQRYTVKDTYTVDLKKHSCTCPDYQNRGLPCKHLFYVESHK